MNPVQILMMNQQKSEGLGYGLLYNGYVRTNVNIAPTGWHVPSYTEWTTLTTYLGGSIAGGKLKETGTVHWLTPNTGADNSSGFTAFGGGYRINTGSFNDYKIRGVFAASNGTTSSFIIRYDDAYAAAAGWSYGTNYGFSIRLIKDTTTLSDGETSTMTDYDDNVYDTICIDTQEWTVQNWKCTHLNNGTALTKVTDSTTWASATTGDLYYCAYNNDENNV